MAFLLLLFGLLMLIFLNKVTNRRNVVCGPAAFTGPISDRSHASHRG